MISTQHLIRLSALVAIGALMTTALVACAPAPAPAKPAATQRPAAAQPTAQPTAAAVVAKGTLTVEPKEIKKAMDVVYKGTGFTPNSPVLVSLNLEGSEVILAGGMVKEDGSFEIKHSWGRGGIPPVKVASYDIVAKDDKGVSGTDKVNVLEPPPTPRPPAAE